MKIYNEGTEYQSIEWEFSDLVGKTLTKVILSEDGYDDRINFLTVDGDNFLLHHCQDCCERVVIESITGDIDDLIGTPILVAEERCSEDDPADIILKKDEAKRKWQEENPGETYWSWEEDSQTWTFYTIRTIKGSVDIRWHGSSNGYYSESVEFTRM